MALKGSDIFLVSNGAGGRGYQIRADNLLTSSQASGMNIIVNEGPNSFRCPVGQLEQKDYKNAQGVDRILLVQRNGESFQVTLKELMDTFGSYARPNDFEWSNTSGSYLWTVPGGVRSISVIAVGGGGAGGAHNFAGAGGGGGSLAYKNNILVRPGERYRLVAGAGGTGRTANQGGTGRDGGNSTITNVQNNETILFAGGGKGGEGSSANFGTNWKGGAGGRSTGVVGGQTSHQGGRGGNGAYPLDNREEYPGGGGGAAGYTSRGGLGRDSDRDNEIHGFQGGGGAGGESVARGLAQGGGGVGLNGQGRSGQTGGQGGSGGESAGADDPNGASYGAGGGGRGGQDKDTPGGNGANGAVRIVWPGTRGFP